MKDHPDGIVLVSNPWATAVSLTTTGMVNCATKRWHWSYRDRSWTWSTAAVYGPVERELAA
ncbi:hypothetical protein ACWD01_31165 [Streptomyces sp. NPDC002835]